MLRWEQIDRLARDSPLRRCLGGCLRPLSTSCPLPVVKLSGKQCFATWGNRGCPQAKLRGKWDLNHQLPSGKLHTPANNPPPPQPTAPPGQYVLEKGDPGMRGSRGHPHVRPPERWELILQPARGRPPSSPTPDVTAPTSQEQPDRVWGFRLILGGRGRPQARSGERRRSGPIRRGSRPSQLPLPLDSIAPASQEQADLETGIRLLGQQSTPPGLAVGKRRAN